MENFKTILKDFAYDLINHCACVSQDKIVLSEPGLENLIKDYQAACSKKTNLIQKEIEQRGGDQ